MLPSDLGLALAAPLGGDGGDGQRSAVGHEVAPGHHRDDARPPERRGAVDPADARVGVGAADEDGVLHAGQRDVGDVLRHALDQARVLLALDVSSQELGCHVASSPRRVDCPGT